MFGHGIITIGASAGGVEALIDLVGRLPVDLPASIFVALHMPSHGSSVLPQILSRRGPLPAHHPMDGEAIAPGQIYVAPPDHHLLIHEGLIRLSRGPRENGVRPAIDPLFRTAALWHGPRVVGVILSGTLGDGSAGLLAIKERGGVAIVQDPDDALFPGMPRRAMDTVEVDHVLPASGIADLLDQLARDNSAVKGNDPMPGDLEMAERFHAKGQNQRTPPRFLTGARKAKERPAAIRQVLVTEADPAAEMPPVPGQQGRAG